MTRNELLRRYPNASQALIRANCTDDSRIHPMREQRPKGNALDCSPKREIKSASRFEIMFTIYSVRPFDWDNHHVKELQDALVRAGILHADGWRVLRGSINPQKAHSQDEEKTVIEIQLLK